MYTSTISEQLNILALGLISQDYEKSKQILHAPLALFTVLRHFCPALDTLHRLWHGILRDGLRKGNIPSSSSHKQVLQKIKLDAQMVTSLSLAIGRTLPRTGFIYPFMRTIFKYHFLWSLCFLGSPVNNDFSKYSKNSWTVTWWCEDLFVKSHGRDVQFRDFLGLLQY